MASATDTAPLPRIHRREPASPLARAGFVGLVFGIVAVYLASVGILLAVDARPIIVGVLTLGDIVLIALALGAGIAVVRSAPAGAPGGALVARSALAGAIAGALLELLVLAIDAFDLRAVFIALSPALATMLSFGAGAAGGALVLVAGGAIGAAIGALATLAPAGLRTPLLVAVALVVVVGVFQELLQMMMQVDWLDPVRETIYSWEGMTPEGAGIVAVVGLLAGIIWERLAPRRRRRPRDDASRSAARMRAAVILVVVLALLPLAAGSYIGQVLMLVGLYILMGMGLNLEVGLAGLLDLGFVAFFAVGAYTTALLTADNPHAIAHLGYWEAMPVAVLVAVCVGVLFGIPVLGVRGDYLAVATMGLGEIVRVIVLSDAASPLIAGAQGILQIPKPFLGSMELGDPVDLFYLTLVCALIAAFVAWRLENSRLGRAWEAVRDDEDVAQALGINLVKVKLLAYGLGAAFAGLAGSIFAVMLTSVYPSSFQLLVSINVLALIIVGGMGSLPGVMVGAIALVGLPELLREFGENRYLIYGVALVVMMRVRPEGLWPSATRRRELRAAAEGADPVVEKAAGAGGAA